MLVADFSSYTSREFLLAALEQANDAVVVIDGKGDVIHFNAAAERMWGIARAEIIGRDATTLGIDLGGNQDGLTSADQPAGVTPDGSREIKITRRDGSRLSAVVSLSRVEIGGDVKIMAFVREITAEVDRRERLALMSMVADRTNRAVVVTDRRLRIVYTNAAFAGMFGYSPSEAKGQRVSRLLAGRHTDRKALARSRRQSGSEEELLVYAKNGDEIWVSAAFNAIHNSRGRLKYVFALLTDISEVRQLRSLQQIILGALAHELPLTEIADLLCRRVEVLAPDIVCAVLHIDATGLIHPLGGPSLPEDYSRSLDGIPIGPDVGSCGSAAFYGREVLARDIDSDPRWQPYKVRPLDAGLRACWSTPIKANDGRVIGTFAFYFRESREPSRWHERIVNACVQLCALAIERKEARSQIARLAFYDTLTGLPNRVLLRQQIGQMIEACPRGEHVALLFLDLDHFKDVNDTLGHAAGDEFLVGLAQRLRVQIGGNGLLGRLGGDEFVIALPNCDGAGAALVASRITKALGSPLQLGSRLVPMSVSMGISIFPDNATDIDVLMQRADAAMYHAKEAGRSTHRMFNADMNRLGEQRLVLGAALRTAIANETIRLFYQPQIRAADGAIYGLEALARWHDPVLGDVSPAKFIPVAEECGLIEQIGLWAIREACRQMAAWRRAGIDVPRVSVNMSPINFQNANLAGLVSETIAANGLPPDALTLEITESVIMNKGSAAVETMTAIRRLGVGLSLDDFGTGYSSLSRLANLPIRELKIDRGFMRDVENEASALAIATAVIRVGQGLKMTVVAEGVETEGQRNLLSALGCDVLQGYLYAPALSPDAFERWMIEYIAARAAAMLRGIKQSLPAELSVPKLSA
ncbi:MAG: EAL domain-containing protein [Hyphomicrobiales bacterium]|nr:EAL domain-containing protein [Hyphomicrobiales bacterium]